MIVTLAWASTTTGRAISAAVLSPVRCRCYKRLQSIRASPAEMAASVTSWTGSTAA
jgi:hypothetical protein